MLSVKRALILSAIVLVVFFFTSGRRLEGSDDTVELKTSIRGGTRPKLDENSAKASAVPEETKKAKGIQGSSLLKKPDEATGKLITQAGSTSLRKTRPGNMKGEPLRDQLAYHFPYDVSNHFPAFIWQTWKYTVANPRFRDSYRPLEASWSQHHPEFIHEVITDQVALHLIKHLYGSVPQVLDAFTSLPSPILKADFFRYLILFARGGIYSDIDTAALKPATKWVPSNFRMSSIGLVIGIEADPDRQDWAKWYSRRIQFCQWTIQSKPGHPVLREVVARITEKALAMKKAGKLKKDQEGVIEFTGPAAWTDTVFAYFNDESYFVTEESNPVDWRNFTGMKEPRKLGDVVVLPITSFSPGIGHSGAGEDDDPQAYVKHLFEGTWKPETERHIGESDDDRKSRLKGEAEQNARLLHSTKGKLQNGAAATASSEPASSNPQMAFPCLDALETRTSNLLLNKTPLTRSSGSGPEPSYTSGPHQTFTSTSPLHLDWGGTLPTYSIAYETWGTLNAQKSNAILLHTGLSASSHAHSTPSNPSPGWWEKFIGPGPDFALDTDRYYVICTNVIGGCYGSTGPSSIDPSSLDTTPYATKFPILTLEDMVRAQFNLLDYLGIDKLAASVGSSMGGMQSLAAGVLFPDRVGKVVSISGCARSHPYSIAMRFVQRQGMKLAREIATVTYRSGPEWENRFSRRRADPSQPPALCPDFLIETYLDHAGEKWCLEYDANSLLYISKAMDLFDLSWNVQEDARSRRVGYTARREGDAEGDEAAMCTLTLPEKAYQEQQQVNDTEHIGSGARKPPADLITGLAPLRDHKILVVGVASDILFPAWQQREIVDALRGAGNKDGVRHVELGEDVSLFGHDTFLLDTVNVGGVVGEFLR
ncbi:hypothetical protein ABW20_dc0103938 [Dactylellina cionopaga]|nr:hypothetical protein ABW20_dc0103938 [Dactylellina cionopaga]